jgi:hypothetical protein
MRAILQSPQNIELVFEDFKAQFFHKAHGDIDFICSQAQQILDLVKKTEESTERQRLPIQILAVDPRFANDPVASFELTLSLKRKTHF